MDHGADPALGKQVARTSAGSCTAVTHVLSQTHCYTGNECVYARNMIAK
jgi:hypothetical protein